MRTLDQQQAAEAALRERVAAIEQERTRLGAFLYQQARVFTNLSQKFDPVIRRLVALDAETVGGNRSTLAIDSLKIIAFDLACLSIEGNTRIPAFLVHDSLREADLRLSLYHHVFHLPRWLEGIDK